MSPEIETLRTEIVENLCAMYDTVMKYTSGISIHGSIATFHNTFTVGIHVEGAKNYLIIKIKGGKDLSDKSITGEIRTFVGEDKDGKLHVTLKVEGNVDYSDFLKSAKVLTDDLKVEMVSKFSTLPSIKVPDLPSKPDSWLSKLKGLDVTSLDGRN